MAEIKVSMRSGRSEWSATGEFAVAGVANTGADGSVTARLQMKPSPRTGFGLFLLLVEGLRKLAQMDSKASYVQAAQAALAAIDASDPSKKCPFCGRRPRKDSKSAVWTADHVLLACERCKDQLKR